MDDLEHSSIFILMANPGLKNIDYYAEQENEELKKTLKNNLIQEDLDKEFPFACLNPKFLGILVMNNGRKNLIN